MHGALRIVDETSDEPISRDEQSRVRADDGAVSRRG